MMSLKAIFPPVLASYRLLAEKRSCLYIGDDKACVLFIKFGKSKLYLIGSDEVVFSKEKGRQEELALFIVKHKELFEKAEERIVLFSASSLIIKELMFPFVDRNKIETVLPFELDTFLPFPIEKAAFDFFISSKDIPKHEGTILAVAGYKEHVHTMISFLEKENATPDRIGVDLFALYALYKKSAHYEKSSSSTCIVDLAIGQTRLLFCVNGQLRFTRVFQTGIHFLIQAIEKFHEEGMKILREQGCIKTGNQEYDLALHEATAYLLHQIQFSLTSFLHAAQMHEEKPQVLFTPEYGSLPGFLQLASAILQTECTLFSPTLPFLEAKDLSAPIRTSSFLIMLGGILPEHEEIICDIKQGEVTQRDKKVTETQLIAFLFILFCLFIAAGSIGYTQISSLSARASSRQKQAVSYLKEHVDIGTKSTTLKTVLDEAKKEIEKKREVMGLFKKNVTSTLEVCYELKRLFDVSIYKVSVDQVDIIKSDPSKVVVAVSGKFRSKTGNDHFTQWAEFEKKLYASPFFLADMPRVDLAEDGSVIFMVSLAVKEVQGEL